MYREPDRVGAGSLAADRRRPEAHWDTDAAPGRRCQLAGPRAGPHLQPMPDHPASAPLARLEPFVGEWRTSGTMAATGAAFHALDSYEWVAGGRFLLHRWDAAMPDGRNEGVELIGWDAEGEAYRLHSFDSSGAVTVMRAECSDGEWTFTGDTLRFTGRFGGEGRTLAGRWELREPDGGWTPLMDVKLRRR